MFTLFPKPVVYCRNLSENLLNCTLHLQQFNFVYQLSDNVEVIWEKDNNKIKIDNSIISDIPEGFIGEIFLPTSSFVLREFNIFYNGAINPLYSETKDLLKDLEIGWIEGENLSSEDLAMKLNACQLYLYLGEGDWFGLEAAACGVIPLTTRIKIFLPDIIGLAPKAEVIASKIRLLCHDLQNLMRKSYNLTKAVYPWQTSIVSKQWGEVLEKAILRKRGLKLL